MKTSKKRVARARVLKLKTIRASARTRSINELVIALYFLLLYALMQGAYVFFRGSGLQRTLIDDLTVRPATWIVNTIHPAEHAVAQANRIVSHSGGLTVLPGCEGSEALFLMLAALIAFPLHWRSKRLALMYCVLLVFAINQCRLVALYFTARYDRALFSVLHGFVGPAVIILICTLFFVWWIGGTRRNEARAQ